MVRGVGETGGTGGGGAPPGSTVVVLLAGGAGQRLWPLSRPGRPKQFAPLLGDATMIEQAWARALLVAPADHVLVVVTRGDEDLTARLLPDLPPERLIVAPTNRDTLPSLVLAMLAVEQAFDPATVLVLAADTWVDDDEALARWLRQAVRSAEDGPHLVSLGIRPDHPSTLYGYMECGAQDGETGSYLGLAYHEKPDAERAAEYVRSGRHDWNSGMFAWTTPTFWQALESLSPVAAAEAVILRVALAADGGRPGREVATAFATCTADSLDRGLLERVTATSGVQHRFVRADVAWDDLGSYSALARHLPTDVDGNACRGDTVLLGVTGSVVVAGEGLRVRVSGVDDLVVCAEPLTQDGRPGGIHVLVAHRHDEAAIRRLGAHPPAVLPLDGGPLDPLAVRTDEADNRLVGLARVVDAQDCEVRHDGVGTVALVGVRGLEVVVDADLVTVGPRPVSPTDRGADRGRAGSSPHRFPLTPLPRAVTVAFTSSASRLVVADDDAHLAELAAHEVVHHLQRAAARLARPTVVLSAGRTPLLTYALLRGPLGASVPWQRLRLVQMDEYVGVSPADPLSLQHYLRRELAGPLGMELVGLDGCRTDDEALRRHEDDLRSSGLDLVLHGVGTNGHLGFNEPGSQHDSCAARVTLAPDTRRDAEADFGSGRAVPQEGLTLGLAVLRSARRIVVLASGAHKAHALAAGLRDEVGPACPLTSVRGHGGLTVVADRAAAHVLLSRETRLPTDETRETRETRERLGAVGASTTTGVR